MKNTLIIIFLIFVSTLPAYNQSLSPIVITSSGNYNLSAAGSLQWTIGEPIIETFTSAGSILTQGFQQSNYNITETDSTRMLSFGSGPATSLYFPMFTAKVFPNPVSDIINVNITSEITGSTKVELLDFSGRSIFEERFIEQAIQINLQSIPPGIYFMRVSNSVNGYFKTFKIEKTYN